jgi:hypothetical protein
MAVTAVVKHAIPVVVLERVIDAPLPKKISEKRHRKIERFSPT